MKEDIAKRLDAKIPESVVEIREQAGRQLSYLSGAYVINRLNEILGHGKWSYSVRRLEKVFEGKIPQRSGEVYGTSYIATVLLSAKIDGQECYYEDVGYGDGTDRNNPGKAHELAVKEAITDGIKRAAKNLGRSMGLGLYFKDGQYVEETPKETLKETAAQSKAKIRDVAGRRHLPPIKSGPMDPAQRQLTRDMIRAAYRIIKDQAKISSEDFKSKYLGGKKIDEMSDDALVNSYKTITKDFQEML